MTNLPAKLSVAAASAVLGLVSLTPIATLANNHIITGSSSVNVSVSNEVNNNIVSISGSRGEDTNVAIFGNGSRSDNSINVDVNKSNSINQSNSANITNNINVVSSTGGNSASSSTESSRLMRMRNFCLWHPWMSWCR